MNFAYIEALRKTLGSFCFVVLLLNGKVLLPQYSWNCGQYLFWCCCWPGFYVCCEWYLESTILTFYSLPLFRWCPCRGPLRKCCCLLVIVEKTSLGFCLVLTFRNCFVFLGSPVICFRPLKCHIYKILKAWPSNITGWSKFIRISGSETSTCLKRELLTFSTVVQTLNKGPITLSDFCSSLIKFESVATSRLPALFSNIRPLIKLSIFPDRWRLTGTGFTTKMLSNKSFSGINLLEW